MKYTYKGTGEPIKRYSISISEDGTDWKEIKKGTFQLKDGVTTVHFDKENDGKYYIYDAAYVKITALDSNRFAATEIDILSPVGDSVWLDQFGILAEDSEYWSIPEVIIAVKTAQQRLPAQNAAAELQPAAMRPESPRVPSYLQDATREILPITW